MSSPDVSVRETGSTSEMVDQWIRICYRKTATYLDEVTGDLQPSGLEPDLITASRTDKTLMTVWEWVWHVSPPSWSVCAGLSPELRSWHLAIYRLIQTVVCGTDGDGITVGGTEL